MVNASVVQVYWEQFGYIVSNMHIGMEEHIILVSPKGHFILISLQDW